MTREAPKFRLDPRARAGGAARRAAAGQLDHALAGLAGGGAGPEPVHEARKVCKKLRAELRLLRPLLGRAYRAENARLREVARALAAGREDTVLRETAEALFGGDPGLAALARHMHARPRPPSAPAVAEAGLLLAAQRRRVDDWPLGRLSHGSLLAGLLAGYRRARRAYREARRTPTAAALHEWRKHAKYYGYQSALLSPLWPEAGTAVPRLKKLSDLLGEHHDLQVLGLALRGQRAGLGGDAALLPAARAKIRSRQHALAADALDLGKRLFHARPVAWLEAPPAP